MRRGHARARCAAREVERSLLEQPLRRDGRERVLDDPLDLVPVDAVVQLDAEPAAVPDIRWTEESLRVGLDEQLLVPRRSRAPDREAAVAVEVVEEHEEALLLPHEERGRAVAQPLARLGQA